MNQYISKLNFETMGLGLIDITNEIKQAVKLSNIETGIVNLSIMHTSASLIIQENASNDVQRDLLAFLDNLVPMGDKKIYEHRFEGRDDMPAHIKTMLTNTNLTLSIIKSKLQLGVWQGIFLFEHREKPHTREIMVHCIGKDNKRD